MPYLPTAQEWLTQSTLLLQARPTTTRITTKYTITPPPDPSELKPRKPKTTANPPSSSNPTNATNSEPAAAPEPIRATLTLKTYDPLSGSTLKYRTNKAAEVSRLIQILGRLARPMAGLPEVKEDVVPDAGAVEDVKPVETKTQAGGAGGGGGGKKKGKKGKK